MKKIRIISLCLAFCLAAVMFASCTFEDGEPSGTKDPGIVTPAPATDDSGSPTDTTGGEDPAPEKPDVVIDEGNISDPFGVK